MIDRSKPYTWGKRKQNELILAFRREAYEEAVKAYYYYGESIPLEELVSCAYVGLVASARRYEPDQGIFWPYAYRFIRWEIWDTVAYYKRHNTLQFFPHFT